MDVINDPKIALWLNEEWDQTLDWNEGNISKLAKHSATVTQIESVFDGDFILGGKVKPPACAKWNEERFILYGRTEDGRHLTIIWTVRASKIRPITCRSMRKDERKIYEERF